MTDVLDRAQEREEELRDDALSRQRRLAMPADNVSAEICDSCGLPIEEARRVAVPGVQTCVECQDLIERQNAQYRRYQ